jgi:hypothetical protein
VFFAWNANIFFILKKLFLTSVHQHQNTLKQFKNIKKKLFQKKSNYKKTQLNGVPYYPGPVMGLLALRPVHQLEYFSISHKLISIYCPRLWALKGRKRANPLCKMQ